jgi:hypothetical protein
MLRSDQINELATALSDAQGKFPLLQKRTKAYNYMYADLAEMIECVQPVLESNGLSLSSEIDWEKGILTMWLLHSSGQHLGCAIKLHYKGDGKVNEMQAMGSAISYARRYEISCLLNLAADKESDDDGHKSSPKSVNTETGEVKLIPLTEFQCAELDALLEDDDSRDWVVSEVTKRKGVKTIYEIDSIYFERDLKNWLKNRRAKVLEKNNVS